jgi:hypothetical protein
VHAGSTGLSAGRHPVSSDAGWAPVVLVGTGPVCVSPLQPPPPPQPQAAPAGSDRQDERPPRIGDSAGIRDERSDFRGVPYPCCIDAGSGKLKTVVPLSGTSSALTAAVQRAATVFCREKSTGSDQDDWFLSAFFGRSV